MELSAKIDDTLAVLRMELRRGKTIETKIIRLREVVHGQLLVVVTVREIITVIARHWLRIARLTVVFAREENDRRNQDHQSTEEETRSEAQKLSEGKDERVQKQGQRAVDKPFSPGSGMGVLCPRLSEDIA